MEKKEKHPEKNKSIKQTLKDWFIREMILELAKEKDKKNCSDFFSSVTIYSKLETEFIWCSIELLCFWDILDF